MTEALEEAHIFNLKSVVKMMQPYLLGCVERPVLSERLLNQFDKWKNILYLTSTIQNNINGILYFDKEKVDDRARHVPFLFIRNVVNVIFGVNGGYFKTFFDSIDSVLASKYTGQTLSVLRDPRKSTMAYSPLKLFNLGQLAIELGIDEIKRRKLSRLEKTEANQLHIYAFYTKAAQLSWSFFESVKNCIANELSQIKNSSLKDVDSINEQLQNEIDHEFNKFVRKIDTPQVMALMRPKNNILTNALNSNARKMLLGTLILGITYKAGESNYWFGGMLLFLLSALLLKNNLNCASFFNSRQNRLAISDKTQQLQFQK